MTKIIPSAVSALWRKTDWRGEPAWSSTNGAVRAVVSEARARLIYFGAADGTLNLLNAPASPPRAERHPATVNRGGHRFWLGPQNRWRWPPPADWEYSAAHDITADETRLTLRHPRNDPAYPALAREYAWNEHGLHCTASWTDEGEPWFGIHVLAVDAPFAVTAQLSRSTAAPSGVVLAEMIDEPTPFVPPQPAVTLAGSHGIVRGGFQTAKFGFVPQPLRIERPRGWTLAVLPGPTIGTPVSYPDHGYLSQVWVGDPTHDLAEVEQLTPYLRGAAAGRCSSTIHLEATPPA